jgi:hypothetical protein
MRATQRKSDIATARAVATFTHMGCDVSIPLTESAFYDLIVASLTTVTVCIGSATRRRGIPP